MNKTANRVAYMIAVLGLTLGMGSPANAGLIAWNFSYDFPLFAGGPDVTASGTLTTTDVLNSDGSYTITGISGTRTYNGSTDHITALLAPGTDKSNDDELFATSPQLTSGGFAFAIDNPTNGDLGTNQVHVFFEPAEGLSTEFDFHVGYGPFTATQAAGADVPEIDPGSAASALALLGMGVAMVSRRRKRAAA